MQADRAAPVICFHDASGGNVLIENAEQARRSALEPVKKAALTFKRHLDNILTYCVHGITNAAAESLNSRIMALKRISSGRRNKENFKTAVYFFHGGLDVYP